jgi:hypothetical protein
MSLKMQTRVITDAVKEIDGGNFTALSSLVDALEKDADQRLGALKDLIAWAFAEVWNGRTMKLDHGSNLRERFMSRFRFLFWEELAGGMKGAANLIDDLFHDKPAGKAKQPSSGGACAGEPGNVSDEDVWAIKLFLAGAAAILVGAVVFLLLEYYGII